MEYISSIFKGIVFAVGSFVSFLVGGVGLVVTILLGMMGLDYISGLIVGFIEKNLSSRIGIKGLMRKVYILLLIGAVYMIEALMFETGYIADGVTIAFIVTEFISVTENGAKIGVPIPRQIRDVIAVLKEKGNGKSF
ncbi:phage holin family protein [Cytobacillus sp. Hm23]